MAVVDEISSIAEPFVVAHGCTLYDVTRAGGKVLVAVQADGGVDLDTIAAITRDVSRALDEADPISGKYTLEISSPGLERRLRTPAHFAGAIGETVTVKTNPSIDGPRRTRGVLVDANDADIGVRDEETLDVRRLPLRAIDSARTVFVWESDPKPKKSGKKKQSAASTPTEPTEPGREHS